MLYTDAMETGIVTITFVERQADAICFWVIELDEEGPFGELRLLLAHSQFILLDFLQRRDCHGGLICWSRILINTMVIFYPPPNAMGL